MPDSHVLLYRAHDRVEASLLAHVLESADVPVALVGGNAGWTEMESSQTEIWVRVEDLERGREALAAFRADPRTTSP